jgi:KDO2-lipid IV(A) lauroyltransferase
MILVDYAAYWVARLVVGVVAVLPLPAGLALTRGASLLLFLLDRRHRRIAEINLAIAFPDLPRQDRLRCARRSFENMGAQIAHLSHFPRLRDKRRLDRLVRYRQPEEYQQAKAEGRPVLFLTGHLGGWELMAFSHAVNGRPIHFVYRPLGQPRMDRWLLHQRCLSGNRPVPKRHALRPLLRALGRGEDVGILADQNVQPQDGIFVNFFGRPACMTIAPALLAIRSRAVVIPVFLVPDPDGPTPYMILFRPSVPVQRSPDLDADIRVNTAAFAAAIEDAVRHWPDLWLWSHRRWKTRPPDEPEDPYARL